MPLPTQQLVVLNFQDASGNPLAVGYVLFRLSVDISAAQATGPQIVAGRVVKAMLDSTGTCNVFLWPNADLLPAGSVYFVEAYTAHGQLAWQGELTVNDVSYILQEDGVSLFLLEGSTIDGIIQE